MHSGLGDALANWAASFHVRGELGRAREFVERAIVAHGEAIRRTSVAAGMGYGWRLGRTRLIHAAILVQMGEPEAAAETVEAALEDCGEDPQALHEAAGVLALCASAASEPPLADDYTQRAVDLLQSALDLGLSTLRLDAPTLQALRSHPRFAALRAGSQ